MQIQTYKLFLQTIAREDFLPIWTTPKHRHMGFYGINQHRMKGSLLTSTDDQILLTHSLFNFPLEKTI